MGAFCSCLWDAKDDCLGKPGKLEEPWRLLLPSGEIFASLVLSTLFSEKYQGHDMQAGATAEVRLPALPGEEPRTWTHTLLHRAGSKEVSAFIWLGDERSQFPTLYVAFSPLRKQNQFLKLLQARSTVVPDTFREAPRDGQGSPGAEHSVPTMSYVQKKLSNLWQKYDFDSKMSDALRRYPQHLVICCGISHGATLAQATALRLSLMRPWTRFQAVTWNAYKWTNEAGVALMQEKVGKRLLPFVLSRGCDWDSIAGTPFDLAPMPQIVFLDADTGQCRPALDVRRTYLGPSAAWRMYRLHFAKTALHATRLAMLAALEEEAKNEDPSQFHTLRRMSTLSWHSGSLLRAWSFSNQPAFAPLLEHEAELEAVERDEDSGEECLTPSPRTPA